HLCLALSFFSYCSGPPRHLHSFPTRRSSDLSVCSVIATACCARSNASPWLPAAARTFALTPRHRYCAPRSSVVAAPSLTDAHASDRKSTRLNSSHLGISYAVFCLKKKNSSSYNRSDHAALSSSICTPRLTYSRALVIIVCSPLWYSTIFSVIHLSPYSI